MSASCAADSEQQEGQSFDIQLMGGEVVPVSAQGDRVGELKKAFLAVKPCPTDKVVKLMQGPTILKDVDTLATLDPKGIMAVFTTPEMSYHVSVDDEIRLVSEGDADFEEEQAKRSQVSPDKWVPSPPGYPECHNLATLGEGASVTASSNLWGAGAVSEQKLLNVLRLGSVHGSPRFVGGDNSFIFKENQPNQLLTIDLGKERTLVRIGSMCYGDRWLNRFCVCTQADGKDDQIEWGDDTTMRSEGGVAFFDREPTPVRIIHMTCKSGHYYGAGARIGPVFAYGWEAGDGALATQG
mmetsp:Transcript_116187/g.339840  ORF Transcript_116187/g.339840 Transcript_116187/m.339840 type:complete len:296 (-) Transcript_116187:108-995(-)